MVRKNINIFNIKKKKKCIYLRTETAYRFSSKIKNNKLYLNDDSFILCLTRYIGQTITIFTISGGESGSGFTGVLIEVNKDYIKILIRAASPPSCTLGNCCITEKQEKVFDENNCEKLTLGTMTSIPINKIAAFVHNII
ncbi:hypothetical protein M2651_06480 [Clostridium sp. SYSU_GA19001]|uniref:hypothetical protein n=1 Tax=Clostridium caldaquaticum TaxID=2940653 RepID=UPI002077547E|nr:hypothetical protein [Clostridium caldaquaticum]MCM8710672.1 hypothetical protein [Clostridium caldaquaticum]